jgi:hypothetical protein
MSAAIAMPRARPTGRARDDAELLYLHTHIVAHAEELRRLHEEIASLPECASPQRDCAEHLLKAETKLLRICAEWMRDIPARNEAYRQLKADGLLCLADLRESCADPSFTVLTEASHSIAVSLANDLMVRPA